LNRGNNQWTVGGQPLPVAAPIWKAGKQLAGAIGIAAPISKVPNEQEFIVKRILQAAAEISVSLGGFSDPHDY